MELEIKTQSLLDQFKFHRQKTTEILAPLSEADASMQPIVDVSPPKWHAAHTTWFFERFVLMNHKEDYQPFDLTLHYLFNSYYESIGERVARHKRGDQSRPDLLTVLEFRSYVDEHMAQFLKNYSATDELDYIIQIGLQHEQQHQELLWTDIKYILGKQALDLHYEGNNPDDLHSSASEQLWIDIPEGIYMVGYEGNDFHFDNEGAPHRVFLEQYSIRKGLVTASEYMEFIEDGGYSNFEYWLSEAWEWIKKEKIEAPEYWRLNDGNWEHFTLNGWTRVKPNEAIRHISYYEADAFAAWKGCRLAKEEEWEVAADHIDWGELWEWTGSSYLPYPGFKKAKGAIGEYNGKFMINQMVLRGRSLATAEGHSRRSYRNFFHPDKRWQYAGIRLVQDKD